MCFSGDSICGNCSMYCVQVRGHVPLWAFQFQIHVFPHLPQWIIEILISLLIRERQLPLGHSRFMFVPTMQFFKSTVDIPRQGY